MTSPMGCRERVKNEEELGLNCFYDLLMSTQLDCKGSNRYFICVLAWCLVILDSQVKIVLLKVNSFCK